MNPLIPVSSALTTLSASILPVGSFVGAHNIRYAWLPAASMMGITAGMLFTLANLKGEAVKIAQDTTLSAEDQQNKLNDLGLELRGLFCTSLLEVGAGVVNGVLYAKGKISQPIFNLCMLGITALGTLAKTYFTHQAPQVQSTTIKQN
jgi:hypothetical protein